MSQQKPEQSQQKPLTIEEQVSLLLAHFNRANNSVAREAENALVKVVQQLLDMKQQYDVLSAEFSKYKTDNPPATSLETSDSKIAPPK